jgi:predicted membrane channel-forming protein YqfA (hemolysin III family)
MHAALRALFALGCVAASVLAWGYFRQEAWALSTWPWTDGRLSNIFVASILAAVALPLAWVAWRGRLGSAAGGFAHLGVILAGTASVLATATVPEARVPLGGLAAGLAAAALGCAGLAWWSHRQPNRDTRPLPVSMRVWFVLYILILIPAGMALVRGVPGIMPWSLKPATSGIYGWVFLAAICSFLYPLLRPRMEYAMVGLLGFLAYDLVLIPPFVQLFATVKPEFQTTLIVYTSALVLSGLVSVWYLFFDRRTRLSRG